jgi:D-threonate/D-erythronate kinase
MLIVLADDFSGACEIAGIGHRYGLITEVQLNFDPVTRADLVVLDTNTRSMSESEAIQRTGEIANSLKSISGSLKLFKKVDSVLRGHIVAEINALHHRFNFRSVLLLSANPGRGRKIINGHYFINEVSLDKTVFATDPDFPITTSFVPSLAQGCLIRHIHINQNTPVPEAALVTGDTVSKDDIRNYVKQTGENDLCCGGAECFEAFLENLGYSIVEKERAVDNEKRITPFILIINGSTVKHQQEKELFKDLLIHQISLPGGWDGDTFTLKEEIENEWHGGIFRYLHDFHIVAVSIDHPIKQKRGGPEIFSDYFVNLIQFLSRKISMRHMHFCLTGGATSSAIIRGIGTHSLKVLEEEASGVVTLSWNDDAHGKITVKPGSYFWPESFIKKLAVLGKYN